jgi:hypothetical protein
VADQNGKRLVLAAVNRGIHRSEDDGATFTRVELPTPWQYTRSVAAKTSNDGTFFVTNGDGPPGSWGRLFRSKDYGLSWHELDLPGERNSTLWTISVHPFDPELIFVCSNLGQIYRSQDGGDSWVKLKREVGEIRSAHWRRWPEPGEAFSCASQARRTSSPASFSWRSVSLGYGWRGSTRSAQHSAWVRAIFPGSFFTASSSSVPPSRRAGS